MNLQEINKKLRELEEVKAALLGEAQKQDQITALEEAQPQIKPGTKGHANFLAAGYGMTIEEAETIIKERDDNPMRWPLEEYRKAKAMLAAYKAKPQVISTTPAWRQRHHSRKVRTIT